MGEVACALTVKNHIVYTQCLEQLRQDDATYRIDGIHTHTELALADSLAVY